MPNLVLSPRIRKSPFYEATLTAGVSHFTVYNKMLLPLSYGDLEGEYRRLIEGVAVWDVGAERQVEVTGPDADALVQYLSARDLRSTAVGQGRYVAMCGHDGSLLNDPVLLRLPDRWWFSLADADMLLWVRAVAAEGGYDVEVSEPDVSPLAIQGPKAMTVAASVFGPEVHDLGFFRFFEAEIEGIPVVVCRSGWSRQGGVEVFLRDGHAGTRLWEIVMAAGEAEGIGPGAPNHVERVESGLLSFGGDTTPGSNPFEAGMARYVDVDTEVDYIGKQALRRVAAEGPARLFVGLRFGDTTTRAWPLEHREAITVDGRQVGTLVAVVRSPRLDAVIGLAQIERTVVEEERTVEANGAPATITTLPFL